MNSSLKIFSLLLKTLIIKRSKALRPNNIKSI